MANSGSVEIPVDAIQAEVVRRIAGTLIKQLQPQIAHADKVSGSVQRRVTYGGGTLGVLILLLAWYAWGTYQDDQRAQVERDAALGEQYRVISDGLDDTQGAVEKLSTGFDAHGGEVRGFKIQLNRITGAINTLYRREYGAKAVPMPWPYPDLVSGATGR